LALWLGGDEDENKDKIVVQGEAISMSEMDSKRLNVVERISVITTDWDSEESWKVPTCPNLTTFCLNLEKMDSNAPTLSLNFQSIKKLRVLDLSKICRIINLSSDIGELINLEFLNLSGSGVVELPIALKKLKNLRVLLMDGMSRLDVKNIPLKVIESLEQLKVFRFSKNESCFPTVQEVISLLEIIQKLSRQLTHFTSVQRLFHSTKLRDCSRFLRILRLVGPKSVEMSSLLSSMSQMKHLEGIHIWSKESLVDGSSITDKCHLGKLRHVHIVDCRSITHLTWLRYAPLLETLEVLGCNPKMI
jgi:AAA+ ATPase superfamily predicted ATPase